eukprot:555217-Pyramimonas_sp.AAC.1
MAGGRARCLASHWYFRLAAASCPRSSRVSLVVQHMLALRALALVALLVALCSLLALIHFLARLAHAQDCLNPCQDTRPETPRSCPIRNPFVDVRR